MRNPDWEADAALGTDAEVLTRCPGCGSVEILAVDRRGHERWRDGMSPEEAFPHMSPEEQEMLHSGTCPRCFDETVREDEEARA